MKNYSTENHGEAKRAYQNRKTGMCRIAAVILTAVFVWASVGTAFAAESRTKINSVSLTVHSTIQAGSSSGNVSVTADGGNYRVGGTEITNEDDDWKGGMTPRVEVTLYADSGYYFNCTSKSDFSFHGDDASYVTCRREDDKETLVLVMKLDKLDNADLSVSGASWDGSSGTGSWNENTAARYYQVKLYRDDSTVMSTTSVYDTSYDFASRMTRKGDYYFVVRAVGSGSEKGDWESSDTIYLTSSEADDISSGYHSSPSSSGGPGNGKYISGGPGDNGRSSASTGGPGAAGANGQNVSTAQGNHWCIDQGGKWFQFKDGSYPAGRWVLIDGIWYCFGQNGYLRCGWINENGKWYYTDSTGVMLVNTRTPDGCYVGGDGAWIQ